MVHHAAGLSPPWRRMRPPLSVPAGAFTFTRGRCCMIDVDRVSEPEALANHLDEAADTLEALWLGWDGDRTTTRLSDRGRWTRW